MTRVACLLVALSLLAACGGDTEVVHTGTTTTTTVDAVTAYAGTSEAAVAHFDELAADIEEFVIARQEHDWHLGVLEQREAAARQQAAEAAQGHRGPPLATASPAGDPCGGWRGLVASYFPAGQVDTACRVMLCESGGNPNAVSPTDDHGLFQINVVHAGSFDWSRRYDPAVNVAFAASLWRSSGWGPWVCAR